jgi:hypothetical protein
MMSVHLNWHLSNFFDHLHELNRDIRDKNPNIPRSTAKIQAFRWKLKLKATVHLGSANMCARVLQAMARFILPKNIYTEEWYLLGCYAVWLL